MAYQHMNTGRIQPYSAKPSEISQLLQVADRDIATAKKIWRAQRIGRIPLPIILSFTPPTRRSRTSLPPHSRYRSPGEGRNFPAVRRPGSGHVSRPTGAPGQTQVWRLFVDPGDDFRADAAAAVQFVHDQQPARTAHRFEHGRHIQRLDGAQVDHLGLDICFCQAVGRFQRQEQRARVDDNGDIPARCV